MNPSEIINFIFKSLWEYLNKKQMMIISVFLFLYLLFENYFNKYFSILFVQPFFKNIEQTTKSSNIWLFLIIIILIGFVYLIKRNYQTGHTINAIINLIGLLVFYNRNNSFWLQYPIYNTTRIFFSDIFILIMLLNFILWLWHFIYVSYNKYVKKINPEITKNKSSFLLDLPWKKDDPDLLERVTAAKKLSEEILKMNSEESFGIGIVGDWGSGKSSFIEMIKVELSTAHDIICIEFCPWKSTSPNLIITDFFNSLKINLSSYSGQLGGELDKYVRKLVSYNKNGFGKVYSDFFDEKENLQSQFIIIDNIIKNFNKKIIIIIDDLDRLDKKEVVETIKLIRNTAKFHNTIFIAAYDRDYVIQAIDGINTYKKEFYLEKIFQIEITLPSSQDNLIGEKLIESLVKTFPNRKKEIELSINPSIVDPSPFGGLTESVNIKKNNSIDFINVFIKNFRDINRLTNSFTYNYSQIEGEVEFDDYLCIEILKVKCPNVYDAIKEKTIISKSHIEHNDQRINIYVYNESAFYTEFKEGGNKINSYSKQQIADLVKSIFPASKKSERSIQNLKHFPIYFSNQLFNTISLASFIKSRNEGSESLKIFIDKSLKNGDLRGLNDLFSQIDEYESQKDFECIIRSKLYLASMNKLDRPESMFKESDKIIGNFYPENQTELKANLKDWIVSFNTVSISLLLRGIILNYCRDSKYYFILSITELQEIVLENLKSHLSNSDEVIEDSFSYYVSCVKTINKDNIIVLLEESNKCFQEFVIKHPSGFINKLIINSNDNLLTLRPFVSEMFGSLENLEKFVNSLPSDSIDIIEFKAFYKKFVQNKKNPILFERGKNFEYYDNIVRINYDTILLEESPQFLSKSHTESISSDFIKSIKGAFSVWIQLKPVKEYLSKPMNFEYVFSHSTNYHSDPTKKTLSYPNVFSISIEPDRTQNTKQLPTEINFRVWISNSDSKNFSLKGPQINNIKNEWYHLLVRWNHTELIFEFLINGVVVDKGNNYYESWPNELLDPSFIGTWGNFSPVHFINSSLYRAISASEYLDDNWVKTELENRPKL